MKVERWQFVGIQSAKLRIGREAPFIPLSRGENTKENKLKALPRNVTMKNCGEAGVSVGVSGLTKWTECSLSYQ